MTRLDLSFNPMTYLGEEAVSMSKLTHLFLDHMSLQDLVNTAVSKSPNLLHLDISHNQLRLIQPFSEGSPKLARLNLDGNPVSCNCYLRPLRYATPLQDLCFSSAVKPSVTAPQRVGDSPEGEADGVVWRSGPLLRRESGGRLSRPAALPESGGHAEGGV